MNQPAVFVLVLALATPAILPAQTARITTLDELRAARAKLAALWKEVKFRAECTSQELRDIVLSLSYQKKK